MSTFNGLDHNKKNVGSIWHIRGGSNCAIDHSKILIKIE